VLACATLNVVRVMIENGIAPAPVWVLIAAVGQLVVSTPRAQLCCPGVTPVGGRAPELLKLTQP